MNDENLLLGPPARTALVMRRGWTTHMRGPSRRATILYAKWSNMRIRTRNPSCPAYKTYGARGVQVDPCWDKYEDFRAWAVAELRRIGGWVPGLSIDRIDNDGNYCPENCQFISRDNNARKGSS